MRKFLYLTIALFFFFTTPTIAQENGVFVDNLKSLQVEVNDKWGEAPVMLLSNNNHVKISFDDLQHDYVRYTYSITHCNSDWSESELLLSEYLDGFNNNTIEDYEQSMNTEMEYNHYTLYLPNDEARLKVSGNYKVLIYEDGKDNPVAQACFSIIEPMVGVSIDISGNTDIDTYSSHQQVNFNINYANYRVNNPIEEFKPVVCQNRRWDNCVSELKPTYVRNNQLIFNHNKQLIFEAGNEYRRFEIIDEKVPTMRIDKIEYHEPYYHATIFTDEQRKNYIYDQDQNGRFYVRNRDDMMNDTESDYIYTHFNLEIPQIPGGELYINGELTNNRISEQYKMNYNILEHVYEITLPLKQGSYNYQYLFVPNGHSVGNASYTEGSFAQTENEYYVYIYHRPFGVRYDKLVGFNKATYLNGANK